MLWLQIHCPLLRTLCVVVLAVVSSCCVLLSLRPSPSALRLKSWSRRHKSRILSSTTELGRRWQPDSEWGQGRGSPYPQSPQVVSFPQCTIGPGWSSRALPWYNTVLHHQLLLRPRAACTNGTPGTTRGNSTQPNESTVFTIYNITMKTTHCLK